MYNLSVIYDEVTYGCMTCNGSCDRVGTVPQVYIPSYIEICNSLFCRIMATSKNCTWKEYILRGGIKKCLV